MNHGHHIREDGTLTKTMDDCALCMALCALVVVTIVVALIA